MGAGQALGARLGWQGERGGRRRALGAQACKCWVRKWGAGAQQAGRAAGEARGKHGARQAGLVAGRGRHARLARPGRWVRGLATGYALGALGLFSVRFDSVLFLSRFLDIVREPGS